MRQLSSISQVLKQLRLIHPILQHLPKTFPYRANILLISHAIPDIIRFQHLHRDSPLLQQFTNKDRNQIGFCGTSFSKNSLKPASSTSRKSGVSPHIFMETSESVSIETPSVSAPFSVFTIFFISTTCTPYTQLPSSIIPFSPAYRQSPKLSTVTVYAYVPSNGNSEEEIKEPLLPKKDEIPAYPLHTAVLLNPLYRFLFFICVDFSQKCGYNIL